MRNRIIRPRHLLIALILMTHLLAFAALGAEAKPAKPIPPDAATRAAVQKLLIEYRKSKQSLADREKVVRELLSLGDEGARRLLPELAKDLKSKRTPYLQKFEKEAVNTLKKRWKEMGLAGRKVEQKVQALRKTVLDVSRGSGQPTKEQIVKEADPAMKELDDLLTVSRDQVLERASELKDQREELLKLVAWSAEAAAMVPPARKPSRSKPAAAPLDVKQYEEELLAAESLAAYMATPMSRPDRGVLVANVAAAKKIDPGEAQGCLILNMMRVRLGIGALAIDTKLCDASRDHSRDMHELKFFSHDSPVKGKEDPWKRAKLAGTTGSAENIFMGINRAEDAIQGWWHSPGHHTNMMAAHRRVGLGRHEGYWTQMFGG